MSKLTRKPTTEYTPEQGISAKKTEEAQGDTGATYSKAELLELISDLKDEVIFALGEAESSIQNLALESTDESFNKTVKTVFGDPKAKNLSYIGYLATLEGKSDASLALSTLFEEKSMSAWGNSNVMAVKVFKMLLEEASSINTMVEGFSEDDKLIPDLYSFVGDLRTSTELLRRVTQSDLGDFEKEELENYATRARETQATLIGAISESSRTLKASISTISTLSKVTGQKLVGNYTSDNPIIGAISSGAISTILDAYGEKLLTNQNNAVSDVENRNELLSEAVLSSVANIANIRVMQLAVSELEAQGGASDSEVNEINHTVADEDTDYRIRTKLGLTSGKSPLPLAISSNIISTFDDTIFVRNYDFELLSSHFYFDGEFGIDGGDIIAGTLQVGAVQVGDVPVILNLYWGRNQEVADPDTAITNRTLSYSTGTIIVEIDDEVQEYSVTGDKVYLSGTNSVANTLGTVYWIYADLDDVTHTATIVAFTEKQEASETLLKLGLWDCTATAGRLATSYGSTLILGNEIVTGTLYASRVKVSNGGSVEQELQYLDGLIQDVTDEVTEFLETTYPNDSAEWTGSWWSASTSDPSDAWNTLALKEKHVGDFWYQTDTMKYLRWNETSPDVFAWEEVTIEANAISGVLTNESCMVIGAADGSVADFTPTEGTFVVYDGFAIATGVTFSKQSETNCTGTIHASTGVYSVTAMDAEDLTASVTFRASYNDVTLDKTLSITKTMTKVYEVGWSAASLARATNDTFRPSSVTANATVRTGILAPTAYSGYFRIWEDSDGSPAYSTTGSAESSKSYTPTSSVNTKLKVSLYEDSGFTTLLDTEEIPVVYDGTGGSSSTSGYLTNESWPVSADYLGQGYSLTGSNGIFKVYDGATDVTTSSSFSITGGTDNGSNWSKTQNGLTLTINESGTNGGEYSLSGGSWTSDSESFELKAVYGPVTLVKTYSIFKVKAGQSGSSSSIRYIIPVTPAIQKTGSTYTPATMRFDAVVQTGTSAPAAYEGWWKLYRNGSGTALSSHQDVSYVEWAITASTTSIRAVLYEDGAFTNILDDQTIYVVTDGVTGDPAVQYWLSPTTPAIARRIDGTISPTTVTFDAFTRSGSGAASAYTGNIRIERSYDGVNYRTAEDFTGVSTKLINTGLSTSYSATNFIVNSDFRNGIANWGSTYTQSFTVADNIATETGDGTNTSPTISNTTSTAYVSGNKIYVRAFARFTNVVGTGVQIDVRGSSTLGSAGSLVQNFTPTLGQWYKVSGVVTPTGGTGNWSALFRHKYVNTSAANGAIGSFRNIVCIDLTTLFGAGSEPTATEVDAILDLYDPINGFFYSTATLYLVLRSLRAKLYLNGGWSTLLDTQVVPTLIDGKTGSDGQAIISAYLTNETHAIPSDVLGNVVSGGMTGSGTSIYLYEGITALQYVTSSTPAAGQWTIASTSAPNVVESTSFTDNGVYVTVGDHTSMDVGSLTAYVDYTLVGKTQTGTDFSFVKRQSLTKTKYGQAAVTVILSNESHGIPTNSAGEAVNLLGSGTDVYVYEGSTALDFIASGTTAAGQWKFTSITGTNIDPSQTITDIDADPDHATVGSHLRIYSDTAYIDYVMEGKRADGTAFSGVTKRQSLYKAKAGEGGEGGRAVNLVPGTQAFTYLPNGTTPSPATTNIVATALNTAGNVYYEWLVDGVSLQNNSDPIFTYTPPANYTDMPNQVEVRIREGSTLSPVLATDVLPIIGLKPAADPSYPLIGDLSDYHTSFPADDSGVVDPALYPLADGYFSVFDGSQDVTASSVFAINDMTNCTVQINYADNTPINGYNRGFYRVTSIGANRDNASATMRGVYNGRTVVKTLTLTKYYSGTDAEAYKLILTTTNMFRGIDGSLTPSTVTITSTKQSGTNAPAPYAGKYVITETGGSGSYTSGPSGDLTKIYTPSSTATVVNVKLYLTNTNTQVDEQSILIQAEQRTGNLLRTSEWVPSDAALTASSMPHWTPRINTSSTNYIISEAGPARALINSWKTTVSNVAEYSGGASTLVTIDSTKTYRFTIYMKKMGHTTDGTMYFGPNTSGIANLDGSDNTNPYFFLGDLPEIDKWYLVVGYVHPVGYGGDKDPTASVYDMDGVRLSNSTNDFEWKAGTTSTLARFWFGYASTTLSAHFYAPRIELVDGTELPLEAFFPTNDRINRKAETFYQTSMPWPEYSNIATNTTYDMRVGDLWYDSDSTSQTTYRYRKVSTGTSIDWSGSGNVDYKWFQQSIPRSVFDLIDGKRQVFLSIPTNGDEYEIGDLWLVDASDPTTIVYNNAETSLNHSSVAGELLVAFKANPSPYNFNPSDWKVGVIYTDDSAAESKAQVFFGIYPPDTTVVKPGDIWIDTSTSQRIMKVWVNGVWAISTDIFYPGTTEINGGLLKTGTVIADQMYVSGTATTPDSLYNELISSSFYTNFSDQLTLADKVLLGEMRQNADRIHAELILQPTYTKDTNYSSSSTIDKIDRYEAAYYRFVNSSIFSLPQNSATILSDLMSDIQYVRLYACGSSTSRENYWSEISVVASTDQDVALGKTPTSGHSVTNAAYACDGDPTTYAYTPARSLVAISSIRRDSSGLMTVVTTVPHMLLPDEYFNIIGCGYPGINGAGYRVQTVYSPTVFTIQTDNPYPAIVTSSAGSVQPAYYQWFMVDLTSEYDLKYIKVLHRPSINPYITHFEIKVAGSSFNWSTVILGDYQEDAYGKYIIGSHETLNAMVDEYIAAVTALRAELSSLYSNYNSSVRIDGDGIKIGVLSGNGSYTGPNSSLTSEALTFSYGSEERVSIENDYSRIANAKLEGFTQISESLFIQEFYPSGVNISLLPITLTTHNIVEQENVSVTEANTVSVSAVPNLATKLIDTYEFVLAIDSISMIPLIQINESEPVTVTDNETLMRYTGDNYPIMSVRTSDNIAVSESLSGLSPLSISVSETATVTSSAGGIEGPHAKSLSDTTTLSESVTVRVANLVISEFEQTVVTDAHKELVVNRISVQESITVTDVRTVQRV